MQDLKTFKETFSNFLNQKINKIEDRFNSKMPHYFIPFLFHHQIITPLYRTMPKSDKMKCTQYDNLK